MFKDTVTYENFEGVTVTKDLYFNLTKAEITKMQLSTEGGFDKKIQSIIDSKDQGKIVELFEELIMRAYGVRTEDGEFVKPKNAAEAFITTEAYSTFFMDLISSESKQKAFFMGIMPKDLAAQASEQMKIEEAKIHALNSNTGV